MHVLSISTPAGIDIVAKDRVRDGQIIIIRQTLSIGLIVVSMTDFDVILEMDWLAENHASIDCHKKQVIFSQLSESSFKFKGTCAGVTSKVFSMMKAKRLV